MFYEKFTSAKILVIGDIILDEYKWGHCERISPEAPVQVIDIKKTNLTLGGAGNVINNVTTLGAKADILSVIGTCENAAKVRELFQNKGIKDEFILSEKNRITGIKTRIISSQQQVLRYDFESTNNISSSSEKKLITLLNKIIDNYDLILLSDYGKGVLTYKVTRFVIDLCAKKCKKVLIDPKGIDFKKYTGATLLTPNKKEASLATQIAISTEDSILLALKKLKKDYSLHYSLITLSEQGIAVLDKKMQIFPAAVRSVFDVTGAGDTVLASLGVSMAAGLNIREASIFANLAAGVVVGKVGSSVVTIEEIISYESSLNKSISDEHIKNKDQIIDIVRRLRNDKKIIAFTNGCFDIVHSGHIKYLEMAKHEADILIVGINSDSSVRMLKGNKRPINNENDRAYIIAAMEAVDYVVIFSEKTPYKLIKAIGPDILLKGGDYKDKDIVGSEFAAEVKLIEYIKGKSSTGIIEKIQNQT